MFDNPQQKPRNAKAQQGPRVGSESLQMLATVLKTAFRLHCTGETVSDFGPWELVQAVQNQLVELSMQPERVISEDALTRYVGTLASSPAATESTQLVLQASYR